MSAVSMRILVLGANGMLGNTIMRLFGESDGFKVYGTVRALLGEDVFRNGCLVSGVDVNNYNDLVRAFDVSCPDVVINCVGLVKQLAASEDALSVIPLNALVPHQLAHLCSLAGARLIHISTDCVFSGNKGMYKEEDIPDAMDLYGRSKCLGEVHYPYSVTLRTSIIGHEMNGARSLLCWFLAQQEEVFGYTRAIFSGLPTVELAIIIRDFVIPKPSLCGLYHVAAEPINKYALLNLIAKTYSKSIKIIPNDKLVIDRSLCSDRFRDAAGYTAPDWPALVNKMQEFR